MFAISLGRCKGLSLNMGRVLCRDLKEIPKKLRTFFSIQERTGAIKEAVSSLINAHVIMNSNTTMFLGRGISYPVALEGALKLKEITYFPAEAHPSGEIKHGPIAMINKCPRTPVIVVTPKDEGREGNITTIKEVKARGARVISIATVGDREIERLSDHTIFIPSTHKYLTPLLSVVPLQLMAYHTAVKLDRDVDKPRNLAKSVTVS